MRSHRLRKRRKLPLQQLITKMKTKIAMKMITRGFVMDQRGSKTAAKVDKLILMSTKVWKDGAAMNRTNKASISTILTFVSNVFAGSSIARKINKTLAFHRIHLNIPMKIEMAQVGNRLPPSLI